MNKTYIKRQLTLNEIGIPMSKDLQDYMDYFYEIVGDPKSLTKRDGYYIGSTGELYSLSENVGDELIFCCDFMFDNEYKEVIIDNQNIVHKFLAKFNISIQNLRKLFIALMEYFFNYKIYTIVFFELH